MSFAARAGLRSVPARPRSDPDDRDLVFDAGALAPDAHSVEALARLALDARRSGRRLALIHVSGDLRGLLMLVGLADVVGLGLEAQRQAEEGKQPLAVEERVDRDDLAV